MPVTASSTLVKQFNAVATDVAGDIITSMLRSPESGHVYTSSSSSNSSDASSEFTLDRQLGPAMPDPVAVHTNANTNVHSKLGAKLQGTCCLQAVYVATSYQSVLVPTE